MQRRGSERGHTSISNFGGYLEQQVILDITFA